MMSRKALFFSIATAAMLVFAPAYGRAQEPPKHDINELTGAWQYDSLKGNIYSHFRLDLRGDTIFIIKVSDKDDMNSLKGDEFEWGRFKLNGRRLQGTMSAGAWKGNPIWGFVAEDFREIKLRWALLGARETDSGRQVYVDETLLRLDR